MLSFETFFRISHLVINIVNLKYSLLFSQGSNDRYSDKNCNLVSYLLS